jgi:hypothetical protein
MSSRRAGVRRRSRTLRPQRLIRSADVKGGDETTRCHRGSVRYKGPQDFLATMSALRAGGATGSTNVAYRLASIRPREAVARNADQHCYVA